MTRDELNRFVEKHGVDPIPGTVQFETISACNAHCSFCPHTAMERAPARMSLEKIIAMVVEMSTWPRPPWTIHPFVTNEPFADARMPEIVDIINQALPETKVCFFTNGSLFSEKLLNSLKGTAIESFHVSLHYFDKAAYENDLGLNWEKTLASIHRLIDSEIAPVSILRVPPSSKESVDNQKFIDFCAKEFPGIEVNISKRYNWKGDIASDASYEHTLDKICNRMASLIVLVDGRSALCCMDQNGDYSWGDTNQHSLLDVYNSPVALSYRTRTKRQSEPCNRCNME